MHWLEDYLFIFFSDFNSWLEDVLKSCCPELPPTSNGRLWIHGFILPTMLMLWPDHTHQFSADVTALELGDLLVQQGLMEPGLVLQ